MMRAMALLCFMSRIAAEQFDAALPYMDVRGHNDTGNFPQGLRLGWPVHLVEHPHVLQRILGEELQFNSLGDGDSRPVGMLRHDSCVARFECPAMGHIVATSAFA